MSDNNQQAQPTRMPARITAFLRYLWLEHGIALLIFGLLSIALSWPTILFFTSSMRVSDFTPDVLHDLSIIWNTQQWVIGNQPPLFAKGLYYPYGASLLTSLGPVTGFFALPFWWLGPPAAYNGATLVSLAMTGYGMYLLARGLSFERPLALFAGLLLMTAPQTLIGVSFHLSKAFIGLSPLMLLGFYHTLNPQRSAWWIGFTALVGLLNLFHDGGQYIFAGLGMALFLVLAWQQADGPARRVIVRRMVLLALALLILNGPFFVAVIAITSGPLYEIAVQQESWFYKPDLAQFFFPSQLSLLFGALSRQLHDYFFIHLHSEKAVSLSWSVIALCLVALVGHRNLPRQSRWWFWLLILMMVFSLGPYLSAFGISDFTRYHNLPIILPYAFLTSLPGLDVMRVAGRFMQVGYIGLTITACYGLLVLMRRLPNYRYTVLAIAVVLVLLERFPAPWVQQPFPGIPDFYQQLADDPEYYGVFDLPVQPDPQTPYLSFSSIYQYYQATHHKGIAAGYLARAYTRHPLFPHLMGLDVRPDPPDFQVNGEPVNVYAHTEALLAGYGYRYLVWHKTLHQERGESLNFLDAVVGEQEPLVDDQQVRVYALDPSEPPASTTPTSTTLLIGQNWYPGNPGSRWAISPATLHITSPHTQAAILDISSAALFDPQAEGGFGTSGTLTIQTPSSTRTRAVTVEHTTRVPLRLVRGTQTMTLSLEAGNFSPVDYGGSIPQTFSFAIQTLNLQTEEHIAGAGLRVEAPEVVAAFGEGWYGFEQELDGRWAKSPAELLVYTPEAREVELVLHPLMVYDPKSPEGSGYLGTMQIATNNESPQSYGIQIQKPLTATTHLRQGWNTLTVALETGNYRPKDVAGDNSDPRWLSFALREIEIRRR